MKRWQLLLLAAIAGALVYSYHYLSGAAPIGSGYAAKYICSQVFLADRDPEKVFESEVMPINPLFRFVTVGVDRKKKQVSGKAFAFVSEHIAIYRRGLGCTLANGISVADLRKQEYYLPSRPALSYRQAWPVGSSVRPVQNEPLQKAIDGAFSEPYPEKKRNTKAVVIVHKGNIVAEQYADGVKSTTPLIGWSMTKTVVALLYGLAAADGLINLDDETGVSEWQDDERKKITFKDLLQMQSGLAFEEKYQPFTDVTEMLYLNFDAAAFAREKTAEAKPGEHWYYSSGSTNILAGILKDRTGGTLHSQQTYIYTKLFKNLRLNTAVIEPDASGNIIGSSYMFASARDWARLGLLLLREGKFAGRQVVPADWARFMITPAGASIGAYGGQTWLNAGRDNPDANPKRVFKKLPTNMFYFSGFNGQNVMVFPDRDVIVVRLGATADRTAWSIGDFAGQVLAALPE